MKLSSSDFVSVTAESDYALLGCDLIEANFLEVMEKEDSTEEELVCSPAPKDVEVDAHEGEDHNRDTPSTNELSDDETIGTSVSTHEKRIEKAPDIHKQHKDIDTSTTVHLLKNELDETATQENHLEKAPDIHEEHKNIEFSNTEHLSNNELDETATDGLVSDVHRVDQEIETSSKMDVVMEDTSNDTDLRGQGEDNPIDNGTSSSPVRLSYSKKDDHENNNNFLNDTTLNFTTKDGEIETSSKMDDEMEDTSNDTDIRGQGEDNPIDNGTSTSPIRLSYTKKDDQENVNDFLNDTTLNSTTKDGEIQTSSKMDAEMEDTSNDINIRGQGDDNGTSSSPIRLSYSNKDDRKNNNNFLNDTTINSTTKDGETLDCVKNEDKEHSSSTEKMETEADHVAEQSKDEASKKMKSKDVEKIDDDSNDQQVITKNLLSEEISQDNASRLALNGTQEPKVEAISTSWPGKASVLTKFVKVKSLYAISNVFHRLSRKSDGQNESNEKDKDIKEVNSREREKESQEVSQTTVEKPGWSLLRSIRISNDKDQTEKTELKEAPFGSLKSIAMKGRIVLYTKLWCQDCKEARLFLRKRRLRYSEINVDVYPSRKLELEKIIGSVDVPIVFFNQVAIGGLNELKALDESGKLVEKIEYVTSEGPSPKAPLPPFSGEDDVSSRGVVDELAVIVRKMKESIIVRDRFYKFRRVTNCFLGSEAVDFLSEDQYLEREEAIEFARKLVKELFFRHVLEENTFEDGNHLYRFLDQDPIISQCQNIPRGIIQLKRQPLADLSYRLRFLLYAILDAYTLEDGRHIAYRTIHGSEEFARYLRIAEELQRVDLNRTAKEERLAFFINLYNLMAIHAILVWGHPEGALDRRKLFSDFKYVIGGCAYSLSDIHNGILRSNQRPPYTLIKPFRIDDKRFKVALPYPEPLIHFALVSGNRSAPALRCYSPKNIDMELMEAACNFLQSGAFILHLDSMTVSVTKILKWYSVDFGKNEVEVLKHAANYLEVEKTQTLLELLDSTQLKVVYQPYDWRLNS